MLLLAINNSINLKNIPTHTQRTGYRGTSAMKLHFEQSIISMVDILDVSQIEPSSSPTKFT